MATSVTTAENLRAYIHSLWLCEVATRNLVKFSGVSDEFTASVFRSGTLLLECETCGYISIRLRRAEGCGARCRPVLQAASVWYGGGDAHPRPRAVPKGHGTMKQRVLQEVFNWSRHSSAPHRPEHSLYLYSCDAV
jgi:hypothetical protein